MTGRMQREFADSRGLASGGGAPVPLGGAGDGIGLLYDAAFGMIEWSTPLLQLLDVFDCDACLICWRDLEQPRGGILELAGLDEDEVVGVETSVAADPDDLDLSRLDPDGDPFLVAGRAWGMGDREPPRRPAPSSFRHRAIGLIHRQDGVVVSLDLLRRNGRPTFDPRHLEDHAPLLGHLRRAWLIRAVLHRAGVSGALEDCLEAGDLLGPAPDTRSIARADGDRPAEGSASGGSSRPDVPAALDGHRTGLAQPRLRDAVDPAGKVAFLQPGARRPHGRAARSEREASVTAIPLFGQAAPELRLRLLYKLTPGESRIATSLAQGHSLQDAADRLEISVTTVRTHLSRIYDKTGTSRQSELVALLLRGPARLDQA